MSLIVGLQSSADLRSGSLAGGVAGVPTALVASYGSGSPGISMMAGIDGLRGHSQKPGVPREEPQPAGSPGHGEGHNTGPAVIVTAALAVQELMAEQGLHETVRAYSGDAEELGANRTSMVQTGLFKDVAVMLGVDVSGSFKISHGPQSVGVASTLFTFHS